MAWEQLKRDEAEQLLRAAPRLPHAPLGWAACKRPNMPDQKDHKRKGAVALADAQGQELTAAALPLTLRKGNRQWSVGVSPAGAMWTEYGMTGGKLTRSERTAPAKGLQGRTAREQGEQEALAQARKKLRAGYVSGTSGEPSTAGGTSGTADGAGTPGASGKKSGGCGDGGNQEVPLPMLAVDWHKVRRPAAFADDGAYAQPKLDGIRALANTRTGKLYSRTGKLLEGLSHIEAALLAAAEVAPPPAEWLDGEVYRHGMDFQDIVGAARRKNGDDRSQKLQLHVFDTVRPDLGFEARIEALNRWTAGFAALSPRHEGIIMQVHTEPVPAAPLEEFQERVAALVARFEAEGYEGVILRRDAPYEPGKRSLTLAKAKNFQDAEFRVLRLTKRERQVGAPLAATVVAETESGTQFEATLGGTEAQRREMWRDRERYRTDGYQVTVRFQELTAAGVPRFPTVVGFRHPDDR